MSEREVFSRQILKEVHARDGLMCKKCHRKNNLNIHHIKAVQDGGDNSIDNLVTLCAACHATWHAFEMVSTAPFNQWMNIPPLVDLSHFFNGHEWPAAITAEEMYKLIMALWEAGNRRREDY